MRKGVCGTGNAGAERKSGPFHERAFRQRPAAAGNRLANGRRLFRSSVELPSARPDILARLRHWAAADPHRVVLTEAQGPIRRALTYGDAVGLSAALHALLVERHELSRGDRIATLASGGIDALLLKLACLRGGFVHVALPPYPFRHGMPLSANEPFMVVAQPKLRAHSKITAGCCFLGEIV